ncbi:MAG TPA: hypothetical protein VFI25_10150 [Planctomycetota bacterium]|jgi:hypothetical protein|nr:hypothetical protein [Planctomycetota bacterium]
MPTPSLPCARSRALPLPAILLAAAALGVSPTARALAQDAPEIPRPIQERLAEQQRRIEELERRLGAPGAAPQGAATAPREIGLAGSTLRFYGFVRGDLIFDDSRPNNTQTTAFIFSEDPSAPAAFGAPNNRGDLTIHPRLTRFGFDLDGPTISSLWDAKVTGKVEVDFYNNGLQGQSESREALRMRHAYLRLGWGNLSFLAGQTMDVISPIWPIVNADLVMWGAGNLGDRRPQFRLESIPKPGEEGLIAQGEVGLTGADDNQDLDAPGTFGAGFRDGETSNLPTLQARLAYRHPCAAKQNLEFGVWGHRAWEEPDTEFAGRNKFDSFAYGADLTVPLYEDRAWLKTEAWAGKNVDDVRGGIFQGINTLTGEEIHSKGGWAEVGVKATGHYAVHAGYSRDDPDNADLNPAGGRAANKIWYLANRFSFDPIEIGLDYFNWTTEYRGFDDGDDNRVQFYVAYKF